MPAKELHPTLFQSYAERAKQPNLTPLAIYLFQLMHLKKTNLCVSADVSNSRDLLRLAEQVGDHICVLKTHADIVQNFGDKTIQGLVDVAKRKKFIIFEDRKFGDIGNTVQMQYIGGPLAIVKWAHLVNAHLFPGPAIITSLSEGAKKAIAAYNNSVETDIEATEASRAVDGSPEDDLHSRQDAREDVNGESTNTTEENADLDILEQRSPDRTGRKHSVVSVSTTISTKTETISPQPLTREITRDDDPESEDERLSQLEKLGEPPFYRSLILLAQMSSRDNFLTPEYTAACATHAREHRDFVMGFIAQESLNSAEDDNFITLTPGVQLESKGDDQGQQYNTPRHVVAAGTDVIIVGRGILHAKSRRQAAEDYRRQGWDAYEERVRSGKHRIR